MKKTLLTSAAILLWAGSALAEPQTVTMPVEDYRAIINQLKTLQSRVDALEHQSPSEKPAAAAVPESKLKKDVASIYDTLDQVETKTLKDKINLGAEVRTRVDNFQVKDHMYFTAAPKPEGHKESNDNNWTNRVRVNMDADIQKNLKFTGRLTAYKNFSDSASPDPAILGDANSAHLPDGSGVKLDRAYIDWTPENLAVPLAITFGRHPSSEGPPNEIKEYRKRQSTYPALLFDGEADGVVATVGLERYLGWKDSALRFAYGKAYQNNDTVNTYLDNPGGIDDTNVFATFFETQLPGLDDSLMVLSALRASDMAATGFDSLGITGSENVGDLDLYGIHLQANNLKHSNFDLFLSLGLDHSHPNGNVLNGPLGPMGLLNNDGDSSHTGWAVYTGLAYAIQSAALNNPKVGFEYNHGSEYWFSFTSGSTELYNKLATRGDVYDLYYIQPFNDYLFGRIGYTIAEYNYGLSGFHIGDIGDSNEELRNAYLLMDCRF
jgi:hypothetical protein